MSIRLQENIKAFHLSTSKSTYVIQILSNGHIANRYWGEKLEADFQDISPVDRAFSPFFPGSNLKSLLDSAKFEYPTSGNGDYRIPALHMKHSDGSTILDLRYKSHKISTGKAALKGLPAVYSLNDNEAETLTITVEDKLKNIEVELSYTVFASYDAITRSAKITNAGKDATEILKAASAVIDFDHSNYDLITLPGSWARERSISRAPLRPGSQSIASSRGASSHQYNPFVALADKNADETKGEVFGMSLVYSGNFEAEAEVDQDGLTRVSVGINSFDFTWRLESGESLQTPELVLVRSSEGFGGMSRIFHKLYRERLCRGKHQYSDRYVLINNWEATYFNFNEELLVSIASEAKNMGVELFVLDDGWFGKRNTDNCSLGDWVADTNKLPAGIGSLSEKITALGMKFGLWFEPEMVSPDSDLYRAHPDWCIHVKDRPRTEGRQQLILDFSRACVREYIVNAMSKIFSSSKISYVKWDMNRHMTETGSAGLPAARQRETGHRYMLGLYEVLETLTSKYPDILFESCSGGGGRFDPGMMFYMPQVWTSDNSDAVSRLKIQYGTSLVYPTSSMGAHVSAVPNHQNHRVSSLEFRGHVAMSGNFGYELDVRKMPQEEKDLVVNQIKLYKEIRRTVLYGTQYRLKSPFEGNECAWNYVSDDKKDVVAFYSYVLAEANRRQGKLKLAGLDPSKSYKVQGTEEVYNGDYLMKVGLITPPQSSGDFKSAFWHLKAE